VSTAALAPVAGPGARPSARWWWDRGILLGGLLAATLLAWRQLLRLHTHAHHEAAFPLLLLLWSLMTVAMMLPAASPMIVTFAAVSRRNGGPVLLRTALFITAYLGVWSLVSIGGALAQAGMNAVTASAHQNKLSGQLCFAIALLGAGLWQLTPLKQACLRRCRTPLGFLITEWRPGASGALLLDAQHGTECVLCCWALMAVMLGLGSMSLPAMAILTGLMIAEKVAPGGHRISRGSGYALMAWGGWQLVMLG